ncbi:MAG: DUF2933 domain-containing protein [Gammaproteobacteria bacterium]|nr:DUF2933 domain-containing protein [Gammaproteobacteria bacterium]
MKTENHQHPHLHSRDKDKFSWRSVRWLIIFIIFVIIGYYLITEHRAHVAGFFAVFPWWILLFLLCPLMHFFHGGHGKHDEKEDENSPGEKD